MIAQLMNLLIFLCLFIGIVTRKIYPDNLREVLMSTELNHRKLERISKFQNFLLTFQFK